MDVCTENVLKKLCCTCLSRNRKLFQLCRLNNGVNNLYFLLSYDSEAYREGFYKDLASLHICWECRAVMARICKFRSQACEAQKLLTSIADGRNDCQSETDSLSRLSVHHTTDYEAVIYEATDLHDNFIDCGLAEVKSESDLEDIPLSELHSNLRSDVNVVLEAKEKKIRKLSKLKKAKSKKIKLNSNIDKNYFTTASMSETEMYESRQGRKRSAYFADAAYKCEPCIIAFKSLIALDSHNDIHIEKPNHSKCTICMCYIEDVLLKDHVSDHFVRYVCVLCDYVTYTCDSVMEHVRTAHMMRGRVKKKGSKSTQVVTPGSKPRRNPTMTDKRTPYGYLCKECNKYFDNKNQRWKHVQRFHKEGYKCATCEKRFAFKNNLTRHEQLHQAPLPREECPDCHKMIRVDLAKVHARIHSNRERLTCGECGKWFASRASYEHHLKYTRPHAPVDILKHKCSVCEKGYRSRGELRDHVNYNHLATTRHKCPICHKPLATRRCITRHVRRAHDGVKERVRDKICQQCGKAFRDKKGLREHELIHSGERPLACEICGGTFRQSASLYTHRKRVHHIYPAKKNVKLVDD